MFEPRGIFAPVATTFNDLGNIDLQKYKENTVKFSKTGLAGLVILGSNGEFVMLDMEEKVSLVETARKALPSSMRVIAGTGCESVRDTIELTRRCADVGANAALVITPHFFKKDMNSQTLENFFIAIADASPIPIMLYNMPGNAGVNIPPSLAVALSKHPNIVGIKDSSGNIVQIAEVIAGTKENKFSVFAGSGSFLLPTLLLGGVGGTLAVANVVPEYCVSLYNAWNNKELDKARELQLGLLELNAAVTGRFGIGGMKAAMEMAGYWGGKPRLPILPATETMREEIQRIYDRTISHFSRIEGKEY
ncbi:MAG: dihydrodipicolinate synthase family protein [Aminobacterium sp.]|jgi:4-hydroxy-2-oxoglutarate aldolase|nr:dihydrodipicolinate synthase family protein [Aminobacterium sp.]MDD3425296.1 dihydrodipicolinate synthase family protein [Aminobacterium sp.]MDD3706873.1 dihydrodipicolinate synthase family protein [Aminobacterium sp.]MDD4551067.1 dihydrodipicolinate synthase family protein [Aminobacterium sp.]